jgi:hypothetical protein
MSGIEWVLKLPNDSGWVGILPHIFTVYSIARPKSRVKPNKNFQRCSPRLIRLGRTITNHQ